MSSLRQLHVVVRHGDRLPLAAPSAGCSAAEAPEARAWAARAAAPSGKVGQSAPWGQLTALGAAQARARGAHLRSRYAGFVDAATRVDAAASNYARSQRSAEALLAGLLAPSRAERVVAVRVAAPADCPYAPFDRGPALRAAQQHVYASLPWYAREHDRLRPVAGVLSHAIPCFRTPSRPFMWIAAADVLTTHEAHGFPLPAHVAALGDLVHDHLYWRFSTLLGHAQPLQLASGDLLAQLAASAVAAATAQARGGGDGCGDVPDVSVHCGHDVTLLPLLLALAEALDQPQRYGVTQPVQASFGDGGGGAALRSREALLQVLAWPGYAAALAFELHEGGSDGAGAGDGATACWQLHWRFFDDAVMLPPAPHGGDDAARSPPEEPWHVHWGGSSDDGGGGGGALEAALQAAASHTRRRRATQLHGSLPLDGWVQLAADVAAGRLGRPMPAAGAVGS
jgi:hypothetical protein